MITSGRSEKFEQIHIDVARNSTDDFNLFHDRSKWQLIKQNPYDGPIVLGFQLESLIEDSISHHRREQNELRLIANNNLRFSNFQFSFVNAVKPGQLVEVDIKKSQLKMGKVRVLSNRINLKVEGKPVILGYKKESQSALFLPDVDLSWLGEISNKPDRSFLPGSHYFLKRKFMNTSNAKNFLCGSLIDQSSYFDELQEKTNFSQIFPCSFISCALLEKALKEKHDFELNPMVYTSHKISIDRAHLARLKSNDILHILVKRIHTVNKCKEFQAAIDSPVTYKCYGLVKENAILYRALISLAPLASILKRPSILE